MLAPRHEREQRGRQRLQVVPAGGRRFELFHAAPPVAVHAAQPDEHALVRRQAADDVVGRAERDVGVDGVGLDCQEPSRGPFRAPDQTEARNLTLADQGLEVRLHAVGERQDEEAVRVVWIRLQPRLGHRARARVRGQKCGAALCVHRALDAAEQAVVVQEELRGQDPLPIELFEQVARRFGGGAQRVLRPLQPVSRDIPARGVELELVHVAEGVLEASVPGGKRRARAHKQQRHQRRYISAHRAPSVEPAGPRSASSSRR